MFQNNFIEPDTLKVKTKKDILVEKILEMIFVGLLRDGDSLPSERELGNIYGVSRETVRSALGMISAYGLIKVSQGTTTKVYRNDDILKKCSDILPQLYNLRTDKYDLDAVYESRKIIESAIIRKVAERIDKEGLKEMGMILHRQKKLLTNPVYFQLSDKEFHEFIFNYANNKILQEYGQKLYSYGLKIRRTVMQKSGATKKSYEEHNLIYDALQKNDPDKAEAMLIKHIDSVYLTTKEAMRSKDSE